MLTAEMLLRNVTETVIAETQGNLALALLCP